MVSKTSIGDMDILIMPSSVFSSSKSPQAYKEDSPVYTSDPFSYSTGTHDLTHPKKLLSNAELLRRADRKKNGNDIHPIFPRESKHSTTEAHAKVILPLVNVTEMEQEMEKTWEKNGDLVSVKDAIGI